ncbi:MAG: hypothetical protein HY553_07350 [Elusimicrobia bacterium]|nr:hypothetical protein [Elusimicrobiota bacterium]
MRCALALGVLLLAPGSARAVRLQWELVDGGGANSFSWAHSVALDRKGEVLFAVGESSNRVAEQELWSHALLTATGAPAFGEPRRENMTVPGREGWGFEDELGAGVAPFGDRLLLTGRYADVVADKHGWVGHNTQLRRDGGFLGRDTLHGPVTPSSFAFATRGLAAASSSDFQLAWALSLQFEGGAPRYLLAAYAASGAKSPGSRHVPPDGPGPAWAGDCCNDPPARLGSDLQGSVYSLLGSRYSQARGFDFAFGKWDAQGNVTEWTYNGTADGTDVADALAVDPRGAVFILAKTSETGTGFRTRLMRFELGVLAWRRDLVCAREPVRDAALALASTGVLWVANATTGCLLAFDLNGNLLKEDALELAGGPSLGYYIGRLVTDGAGRFYAAGSRAGAAWIGAFTMLAPPAPPPSPPKPSCLAYGYPNPFDGATGKATLHYELPSDAPVTLTIFDALGSRVRVWQFEAGQAGARAGVNQVEWDGTAADRRKVGQGMYLGRLSTRPDICSAVLRLGVRR